MGGASLRGSCVLRRAQPPGGGGAEAAAEAAPGPGPAPSVRPAPSTHPAPSARCAPAPAALDLSPPAAFRSACPRPRAGPESPSGGRRGAARVRHPGAARAGRRGSPSAVHASAAARRRRRDGFRAEQPVRLHGGPAGTHHHREAGPPEPQGAQGRGTLPSGLPARPGGVRRSLGAPAPVAVSPQPLQSLTPRRSPGSACPRPLTGTSPAP